jgi:hypothetical protein
MKLVVGLILGLMACSSKSPPPPPAAKPVALAIVYSGWEVWIGNEDLVKADDPSRSPGVLKSLSAAFDGAPLAGLPAGSQAMLISYADKATVRMPMGPIDKLVPAAFGVQKDYFGTMGLEMVSGVTIAVDALAKLPDAKKYLIVLGDGNDTNNEAARPAFAALKKRAAELGIEIYAMTYKTSMSNEANMLTLLTDSNATVATADALKVGLNSYLKRVGR